MRSFNCSSLNHPLGAYGAFSWILWYCSDNCLWWAYRLLFLIDHYPLWHCPFLTTRRRLKRVVTINSYSSILCLFAVHPFIRPRKKDHFVSRLQYPLRSYSFSAINCWCEFGHGPRGVEYHTNAFKLDVIRWRAHNGAKEINFPDSNYRFAHPACNCTDDDDSERLQPPPNYTN